jgi:hypothetical protein
MADPHGRESDPTERHTPPGRAIPDPELAVARPPGSSTQGPEKTTSENLRIIGGLLALVFGLIALVIIVLFAIGELDKEQAGAATTAGITAIGSMVGAYFGIKVGSDGTKEAIKGQKEEATKAQAFALAADPKQLDVIQALLHGESPPATPPQSGANA